MKKNIWLIILFLSLAQAAWAGNWIDPKLKWQMIESEHFIVCFHEGELEIAKKACQIAEKVHMKLSSLLAYEPKEKTYLVIIDSIDESIGAATPWPNNAIYISPTQPHPYSCLGRYEDWLELVITHEYTHVLYIDMARGPTRIWKAILGRTIFPNYLQPLWLIEGYATFEETNLTNAGRGRDPLWDMFLRMAFIDDKLNSIDQLYGDYTPWPGWITHYLYGVSICQYVAEKYGEEKLTEIAKYYAGGIPYFLNTAVDDALSKNWYEIWEEWKEYMRVKYIQQVQEIKKKEITQSTPITTRGYGITSPVWSPSGNLIAYCENNADAYPSIRIMNKDGSDDRCIVKQKWFSDIFDWSKDGKTIVFSGANFYKNFYIYSDLYMYELDTKKKTKLSDGARLRDPNISADGKEIVFVSNKLGQNELMIGGIDTPIKGAKVLLSAEDSSQYHAPCFSHDGTKIAVSIWKSGGFQDVYVMNKDGSNMFSITYDKAMDVLPSWSADDNYVLFCSDRTGVYNLYAYSLEEKKLYQITNVLGGAFYPKMSPDGTTIAFVNYSSNGFDIHLMDVNKNKWWEVKIPEISATPTTTPTSKPSLAKLHPPENYNPIPSALPKFWLPYWDSSGYGAFTIGQDVLFKHYYQIDVYYDTDDKDIEYWVEYTNDELYPAIFIGVLDEDKTYDELLTNKSDYTERQRYYYFGALFPINKIDEYQRIAVGYLYKRLTHESKIPPNVTPPQEGKVNSIMASWYFSNTKKYGFSISPTEGRNISISSEWVDKKLGADFHITKSIIDYWEYICLRIKKHHILAMRLTAGLSGGDKLIQRAFQLGGSGYREHDYYYPSIWDINFGLRGYSERAFIGSKLLVGSLEYRFPIKYIERGPGTLPIYFKRLHGLVFFDIGDAYDSSPSFKKAVGAELKLDMQSFYCFPLEMLAGFAKGLDEKGEKVSYLGIKVTWLY
ncbi:MAG: BamA/TamA family outer membrane protein [bacterium]